MKHILRIIITLSLLLPLAGCRSSKQGSTISEIIEQEETKWQNVSVPVKVQVTQPQKFTFSGTATMVRGEYMLITLRFLGFEVGQACITPETADLVMRQPAKIWLQEEIASRLKNSGITFATLQETLLGDRQVLSKVPKNIDVTVSGTEETPMVNVKASLKGKPVNLTLTWELNRAKWDQPSPAKFSTPGSDFKKTDAAALLKLMGGL